MAAPDQDHRMKGNLWLVPMLDALLALILILVMLANPPKRSDDAKPPGRIVVEIRWPDECQSDVDLWVLAPGDRPVGYSNSAGKVFNLLRDDLGNKTDLSGLNYENAYTRGAPDGDYAVNLHLYKHAGGCSLPVAVSYRVSRRASAHSGEIAAGTVSLSRVGEEVTVLRFTLSDGLVRDRHKLPIKLRRASAWPSHQ